MGVTIFCSASLGKYIDRNYNYDKTFTVSLDFNRGGIVVLHLNKTTKKNKLIFFKFSSFLIFVF